LLLDGNAHRKYAHQIAEHVDCFDEVIATRIAEGHSKLEAIRCLKRYIAREVYALIRQRSREISQT